MDMLRIPTVSTDDPTKADRKAFAAFRTLLKERYPLVFNAGDAYLIGDYGVVIRIPGTSHDRPSVLMAHYDVVPADGEGWDTDPFDPVERDGRIIARGALDTKCTLCAVMEAAEYHLANGFLPANDLILCFGGEEETCGECMPQIVSWLSGEGIRPAFVLDEGGSVIPEGVPGAPGMAAMVGVAEKGTANYMVSIADPAGGHASTPPRHTVIGRLARCAVNIEKHPFPARLSKPVLLMFREISKEVPYYKKPFFRYVSLASPCVTALAGHMGATFNAMVRTTSAITIMEARSAFNVLPDGAAMGVNVRLLEGDTVESAAAHLKKVSGDPDVRVDVIAGTDPTGVSPVDCPEYLLLKEVISETWPGCMVAPYQMNGGTDARHFEEITDRIYRFSPMTMTKEERSMVHGKNESISEVSLYKMIVFYIRLIGRL